MRKFRRIASKVVAFTMAAAMTLSGSIDNFANLSGESKTQAAVVETTEPTVTGTQNADKFSWDNATVYFLLTDRFSNGDTSNDNAYGRQDYANKMSDKRATFHGGDWAGITQKINEGYFDDLGVNAIWLSAPYEQIHGYIQGGDNFFHQSYHGYYVLDYTEPELAFGTREEFKTLVDTAHSHGIRIVLDIVMNHSGYSSMGDMDEYGYGVLQGDWKTYYETANSSTASQYNKKGLYVYYNSKDDRAETPADVAAWAKWWGSDWLRSGVAGYSEGGGDERTMAVAGLPDFKTESTATVGIPQILQTKWKKEGTYSEKVAKYGSSGTVRSYLVTWLSEWVETYGVDGFRCDTAKHVENESWKALKTSCVNALNTWRKNNPSAPGADWTDDFWMTGEVWDHTIGSGKDSYFTSGGFDSIINFGTQGGGVLSSEKVAETYQGYANAINSDSSFNQLSYVSSHDGTIISYGKSADYVKYIGSTFLLLPGAIQIYYGDETYRQLVSGLSFDGYGGAGHSLRSDMNWNSINEEVLAHWQIVGKFRKNHIAVGAGQNTALTASNGIAFARTYSKGNVSDRIAAVVGATANTSITVDLGDVWSDGEAVVNYYDGSVAVVSDGKVTFDSGANGTILIEDKGDGPLVSFTGSREFTSTQTLTVNVEQADYAIISIDGGHKMKVTNGQKITIGSTAYPGDTVTINYSATGEKGSIAGKATFKKKDTNVTTPKSGKIHIKMEDGSAPTVYAWSGTGTTVTKYLGAWPGKNVTTKDSDGYYVVDIDTTDTYNFIVNIGSDKKKTGDITGNKGEIYVTIKSDYTYEIEKETESDFSKMKNAARQLLILTSSDYTSSTWSSFYSLKSSAETLINKGEDEADKTEVTTMYNKLVAAQKALVLATPAISSAATGSKAIKGTAVKGAEVTVVYGGKTYKATADELTGSWSVTTSTSLVSGTTYTVKATWNTNSSATATKTVGGSEVVKPALPTVTLTAGNAQIKATWSAVSGATKYRVFTYLNGAYKTIGDTTSTSYTITGLTNGTKYGVIVLAYNGSQWSNYSTSNIKYATPAASGFVTPAVTLKAQNGQITASWSAVTGATTYRVFTYLNGKYKKIADTTSTSYKITGLTNGTKYGVIVLAYNGSKWSSYTTSNIKYATPTSAGVPSPSITAGNTKLTVKWTAISGGTKYRVFTYDGSFHKVGDTTSTSYTITGLKNGTKYGVLVLVYSDGMWQPYTMADIVYATPKA